MRDQPISDKPFHCLAISGSLRAASSNTVVLRAAAALAPSFIKITVTDVLGQLPHFNPDLDTDAAPASVVEFRRQLQAADGVLICSPEYAHGVPGVLKNALDWVVSSGDFMNKPVVLINASPRSTFAQASLIETLMVMMAQVHPVEMPIKIRNFDVAGLMADPELSRVLREAVVALARTADESRESAAT